jgi:hypothetical protein
MASVLMEGPEEIIHAELRAGENSEKASGKVCWIE